MTVPEDAKTIPTLYQPSNYFGFFLLHSNCFVAFSTLKLSLLSWVSVCEVWLPTAGARKSADGSSPQHRHARQPRKIHKESNLGCDHNEKAAKAQICKETPLIPKGEIIPNMATGGAKSLLPPIYTNQPAIKFKSRIQRFIWGQVEFERLHLASSKCQTIMPIITADWSSFVMPLIKFYAKWLQSETSKSFGCSDSCHRSCAFIPSQKRDQKAAEMLVWGSTAHCCAFQGFPRRTVQLQSFLCWVLRKGRGFTSATQVLCRLRNEGCSMSFKGRGCLKKTAKNPQRTPSQLPPKQTNNKTKNPKTNKQINLALDKKCFGMQ